MRAPSYAPLDDALETLAPYGIELKNGNSNQAPMVAETLCALGRADAVMPWIARYRERMLPRPETAARIHREDWRAALGERTQFADWSMFFGEELRERPWQEVLDRWVERLAPGFCAAATHGVIRVGHATRGLAAGETPRRLRELADAFASWAATYQELPANGYGANGTMTPRQAITRVAVVPSAQRNYAGNITASLATLDDLPEFAPSLGLIDTGSELAPLLSEITEVFARVYLANAHDIRSTIAFIHGSPALPHSPTLRRWLATAPHAPRLAMLGNPAARFMPASAGIRQWPRTSNRAKRTRTTSPTAPSHMATSTSSSSPKRACNGTPSAPPRFTLPPSTTCSE